MNDCVHCGSPLGVHEGCPAKGSGAPCEGDEAETCAFCEEPITTIIDGELVCGGPYCVPFPGDRQP